MSASKMKQDCLKGKETIMGCKKSRTDILLYAEGLLEKESSRALESHLHVCSECREFLVFVKESLLTIEREKNTDPNPFMATTILNALDSSRHRVRKDVKWVPAFAFAIMLVAAVIGGINLGKLYSRIGQVQFFPIKMNCRKK